MADIHEPYSPQDPFSVDTVDENHHFDEKHHFDENYHFDENHQFDEIETSFSSNFSVTRQTASRQSAKCIEFLMEILSLTSRFRKSSSNEVQ